MELIYNPHDERFCRLLSAIQSSPEAWLIVRIVLEGSARQSTYLLAQRLKAALASSDITMLLYGDHEIHLFSNQENGPTLDEFLHTIASKMPQYKCSEAARCVSQEGALKVKVVISSYNSHEKQAFAKRLLSRRKDRKEKMVLVVDDDALFRRLVSKAFEGMSRVLEVADGASAVEAYVENIPDVVFLDIMLPKVSGVSVLEEILDFDSSAYVVMVTTDDTKDNLLSANGVGAKGFLGKPLAPEKLLSQFMRCPTVNKD